jgi:hypothetical protein
MDLWQTGIDIASKIPDQLAKWVDFVSDAFKPIVQFGQELGKGIKGWWEAGLPKPSTASKVSANVPKTIPPPVTVVKTSPRSSTRSAKNRKVSNIEDLASFLLR